MKLEPKPYVDPKIYRTLAILLAVETAIVVAGVLLYMHAKGH